MKKWLKCLLSVGILLLALVFAIIYQFSYERSLVLCAVVFSFAGDLLLMNFLNVQRKLPYPQNFVCGMTCFAFAHILYMQSFAHRMSDKFCRSSVAGYITGMFILTFLVMCTLNVIFTSDQKLGNKKLFIGCMVYGGVIGCNLICLSGYSLYSCAVTLNKLWFVPAMGIICFFVSDCIIAIREFTLKKDKRTDRLVWIFYVLGQTLLILSK